MFELYALTAGVLLPTGIFTLLYFLHQTKTGAKNVGLWTLIFESIATVLLGVFYLGSAVILSRSYNIEAGTGFVNNNIEDLAIMNETLMGGEENIDFYPAAEELPISEDKNEIEGTRDNKNKEAAEHFLQNYQHLVESALKIKGQVEEDQGRQARQRTNRNVDNEEVEVTTDLLENQNCFLKTFLYQALLVYSFATSCLSLLNTCHMCQQQQQSEEITPSENPKSSSGQPSEEPQPFGEKVCDHTSDNSSQNAAPVEPLDNTESIGSATPNLEVFSVRKTTSQRQLIPAKPPSDANIKKALVTAVKCVSMLLLPAVLVSLLYFAMQPQGTDQESQNVNPLAMLSDFNDTSSDIKSELLVKNNEVQNGHSEIDRILRNVYSVINKFQDEHKNIEMPSVKGQYFYKFNNSAPGQCSSNETYVKIFDFFVLIAAFFGILFYIKLKEVKMAKSNWSLNMNKCIVAFSMLWAPEIVETAVSRFIAGKDPNILSAVLLFVANLDRVYAAKRNISMFKSSFCKMNTLVNPVVG